MKSSNGLIAIAAFVCMAVAPATDAFAIGDALTPEAIGSTSAPALPSGGGPISVSYFEQVPCGASGSNPAAMRKAMHRTVHRRPRARVHTRPVRHVVKVRPHALKRIVHHVRRPHLSRGPHLIPASMPPPRCEILHRDRLYRPDTEVGAPAAELASVPVEPGGAGGPPTPGGIGPGATGGGGSVPFAPTPSVGAIGGSPFVSEPIVGPPGGGGGQPVPPVSAAPEPATWALMFTGLALIGSVLRRRSKTSVA